MLRIKKTTIVKLALLSSLVIGTANQALAIDIAIPVSSSDPLITGAVSTVVSDPGVVGMKNDMRDQVIDAQITAKPMIGVMEPLMTTTMMTQIKDQVKPQIMASLSDRTNPNGIWALFAPPEFVQ